MGTFTKTNDVRLSPGKGLSTHKKGKMGHWLNLMLDDYSPPEIAAWLEDEEEHFCQICAGNIPVSPEYYDRFFTFLEPVMTALKKNQSPRKVRAQMNARPIAKNGYTIINETFKFTLLAGSDIPSDNLQTLAELLKKLLRYYPMDKISHWLNVPHEYFFQITLGRTPVTQDFYTSFRECFAYNLQFLTQESDKPYFASNMDSKLADRLKKEKELNDTKAENRRIAQMTKEFPALQEENLKLKQLLKANGIAC